MNYHYVYKITIIETGQYYIGVRSCNVLPENDQYLGSGTIIRAFHRKLPISAFRKEILQTFSDRDAANAHEKYLISLEDLSSAMVLNSFGRKTKKLKKKKHVTEKAKNHSITCNGNYSNTNINFNVYQEFNLDGTPYNKNSMSVKYYAIRKKISNGQKVSVDILNDLGTLTLYDMAQTSWWKHFSYNGKYHPDYKNKNKFGRPKLESVSKSDLSKFSRMKKILKTQENYYPSIVKYFLLNMNVRDAVKQSWWSDYNSSGKNK